MNDKQINLNHYMIINLYKLVGFYKFFYVICFNLTNYYFIIYFNKIFLTSVLRKYLVKLLKLSPPPDKKLLVTNV